MPNTMLVKDLVNEICAEFIDRPPEKLVEMKINSVIHIINSLIGKRDEIINITGSGNDWEDIDTDWSTLGTSWAAVGQFTNDFSYDSTEYKLTIPPAIDKITKIWFDDELWKPRTFQTVKEGSLDDQIYCQIGNDIYFSGDISGANYQVEMQVEMNYPDIADGYVTLENDFRQTLVSGAIMMIATTQKYRDAGLVSLHGSIYEEQLDKMRAQSNSFDSPEFINYGAIDDTTIPLYCEERR